MNDDITLQISRKEAELLTYAVSMLLNELDKDVLKWRNHKDYSLEKLFALMDASIRTGDLWVRMQEALGADRQEIAAYLAEKE